MPKQPEQQQQRALTRPPPCPACGLTMLLVGRESAEAMPGAETFTFECECGQTHVLTTTTATKH